VGDRVEFREEADRRRLGPKRVDRDEPMTTAVPRIALATSSVGPDPSTAGLAMLAGLTARRWRVQHFRSRACPTANAAVAEASGLPGRHLDAWLMPPEVCRSLFALGAFGSNLALVEGTLETPLGLRSCGAADVPGSLAPLARDLDLPIIAVVSLVDRDGDRGTFHLPHLPPDTEAVILDGVRSTDDLERIGRLIRLARGLPVVGAVDLLPQARWEVESAPLGGAPRRAIEALGESFAKHADLKAIEALAASRDFPGCAEARRARPPVAHPSGRLRVAYARDEAFGCYFPDTFEALASLGAELVEFSPIRDGALPEGVDLVMVGCGAPDLHAAELASNLSMTAALRQHVCRGKRIYAEGGGAAYLAGTMIIEGRHYPGVGIFPCEAELAADPHPPTPVTRTLTRDCWLGPRKTEVRGYLSGRWIVRPNDQAFDCPSCYGALSRDRDLYFRHHAVGGLIHLHLAALPKVVATFAGPHQPSLNRPTAVSPFEEDDRDRED